MAIRLSGINSGLDTDAIVTELVKAYSTKTEKYEKEQTKLSWKQEAWKDLNTKIYGLYTNVSNMRYSGAYSLKKVTVSDTTKATVTASSSAVNVSQKLNTVSLAQTAYLTGGKLDDNITKDSMMSALGYAGGNTEIEVQKEDGTKTSVKITKTTKISDVINGLKEAGVDASFDEKNKRIFVSAKDSGAANNFSLVGKDEDGQKAIDALGLSVSLVDKDGNFTSSAANLAKYWEYFDTDATTTRAGIQAKVDAYYALRVQKEELEQKIKDREPIVKAYSDAYNATGNYHEALRARATKEAAVTAAEQKLTDDYGFSPSAEQLDEFKEMSETELRAKLQELNPDLTEDEMNALTQDVQDLLATREDFANNEEVIAAYEEEYPDNVDKYGDVAAMTEDEYAAVKEQRLSEFNTWMTANNQEVTEWEEALEQVKEDIKAGNFSDEIIAIGDLDVDVRRADAITKLVNNAVYANEVKTSGNFTGGVATKIEGADAKIILNGVEYTNNTNDFSVNGLNISVSGLTGEGDENAITINTSTDTQGIYDKVKDFLTEYNNVINEITKLYNADSAKDYEPLTDEEKDAMSDTEIEKWETKIKDSLLRRDTSLAAVMNAMTGAMAKSYTINGKSYSLASFGIKTLGYFNAPENENNSFHIDGDEDDENTSGKEDKLMKAITEDPDSVIEFMKKLSEGLYEGIDQKMKSTSLSSAYKVYNDKEMDKQYANYTSIIKKWEEKISDKEDYYYKKFTAMETAMAKLNNQTSSISGLLGQ